MSPGRAAGSPDTSHNTRFKAQMGPHRRKGSRRWCGSPLDILVKDLKLKVHTCPFDMKG